MNWTLIATGCIGLVWLVFVFDTSVPSEGSYSNRIHNVGLISDRQTLAVFFGSMALLGGVLRTCLQIVFCRASRREVRAIMLM